MMFRFNKSQKSIINELKDLTWIPKTVRRKAQDPVFEEMDRAMREITMLMVYQGDKNSDKESK